LLDSLLQEKSVQISVILLYKMVVKGSVGIHKVLHGIMKYRMNEQRNMVEQFKKVRDNPVPTAVFVTCVDSRMLPTRFTQTNVGDMFIIRNAGNMVPHSSLVTASSTATEPAVLELACVMNQVKHVVICGHSDCKAVNLLYDIHTDPSYQSSAPSFSPLRNWVTMHGNRTMEEFIKLEQAQFRKPLLLNKLNKKAKFPAYVDVDEKFSVTDKLSMANTLMQMENVTSYPFMRGHRNGRIHIHAFWFDIYTGEIHCFSRKAQTFMITNEDTLPLLQAELDEMIERGNSLSSSPQASSRSVEMTDILSEVKRNFSTCALKCSHSSTLN